MSDPALVTRVAVLETLVKEKESAIMLQAREYERRLTDLNHAHQRADDMLATYLTQAVYIADKEALDIRLRSLEKWQQYLAGAIGLFMILTPIFLHYKW